MEGRGDGTVPAGCQMQEVEHVSAGNGAIRVHKAATHIQELHMSETREGATQESVYC